jgi:hypothetical protein
MTGPDFCGHVRPTPSWHRRGGQAAGPTGATSDEVREKTVRIHEIIFLKMLAPLCQDALGRLADRLRIDVHSTSRKPWQCARGQFDEPLLANRTTEELAGAP